MTDHADSLTPDLQSLNAFAEVHNLLDSCGICGLSKDTSPEDIELALRQLAASLDGADGLRRQAVRTAAFDCLKKAGVTSPGKWLDAALTAGSTPAASEGGTPSRFFTDPEPWPDPVDGAELLDEIVSVFKTYLALSDGAAETLALWAAHTHCFDLWSVTPRLGITSPTKRCGKTLTLDVLQRLVSRPLPASNITAAATFRAIEKFRPTVLIDEADTFLKKADELRGVLNSGHSKNQAFAVRCVGDDNEAKIFSTWAPAAIALIGPMPAATLEDRAIVIAMRRKTKADSVQRLREGQVEPFQRLRRQIARWVQDREEALTAADPTLPESLDDRACDNWTAPLSIADVAGGAWPSRAREVAVLLSKDRADKDEGRGELLLADLQEIFGRSATDRLATADILEELHAMEERPWPEYRNGKGITPRGLANLLRPFGIQPTTLRMPAGVAKGYDRNHFEDVFRRYLPDLSVTSVTSHEQNDLRQSLSVTKGGNVTDRNRHKSLQGNIVTDVTDRIGGAPGETAWRDLD